VQKEVARAKSAIQYPPMQKGASFNLEAVKTQIEKGHRGTRQLGTSMRIEFWDGRFAGPLVFSFGGSIYP
jgi:hypothetical protein